MKKIFIFLLLFPGIYSAAKEQLEKYETRNVGGYPTVTKVTADQLKAYQHAHRKLKEENNAVRRLRALVKSITIKKQQKKPVNNDQHSIGAPLQRQKQTFVNGQLVQRSNSNEEEDDWQDAQE